MTDRQLVDTFLKNQDERAFLNLYRSKTPHLYKMAFRLTQNGTQADDLIQEMWIIAIRKLDDFQWRSELKTWLIGILINLFRSNRKQQEQMMELDVESMDQGMTIETQLLDAQDLEMAISKLPPGYRQIVILHDIEGYKHHEIAALLDISEGTSKSQLFYARKALRDYLREETVNKNLS